MVESAPRRAGGGSAKGYLYLTSQWGGPPGLPSQGCFSSPLLLCESQAQRLVRQKQRSLQTLPFGHEGGRELVARRMRARREIACRASRSRPASASTFQTSFGCTPSARLSAPHRRLGLLPIRPDG